MTVGELSKIATRLGDSGTLAGIVVISVVGFDQLTDERGAAIANSVLLRIFQATGGGEHPTAQVGPSQFAVVLSTAACGHQSIEYWASNMLAQIGEDPGASAFMSAGVFAPSQEIAAGNGFELAQFAASVVSTDNRVVSFDTEVARRILVKSRSQKLYDRAIEDYKKLRSLGVDDGGLDNIAGLCFLEGQRTDLQASIQAFEEALSKNSKSYNIWLNKGLAEVRAGALEAAANSYIEGVRLFPATADILPVYVDTLATALGFEITSRGRTRITDEMVLRLERLEISTSEQGKQHEAARLRSLVLEPLASLS